MTGLLIFRPSKVLTTIFSTQGEQRSEVKERSIQGHKETAGLGPFLFPKQSICALSSQCADLWAQTTVCGPVLLGNMGSCIDVLLERKM